MRETRRESEFAEDPGEIATDEIREFREADLFVATADPKFKEALRQMLWDFPRRPTDRTDVDDSRS